MRAGGGDGVRAGESLYAQLVVGEGRRKKGKE